jgi:hypothetical protein
MGEYHVIQQVLSHFTRPTGATAYVGYYHASKI